MESEKERKCNRCRELGCSGLDEMRRKAGIVGQQGAFNLTSAHCTDTQPHIHAQCIDTQPQKCTLHLYSTSQLQGISVLCTTSELQGAHIATLKTLVGAVRDTIMSLAFTLCWTWTAWQVQIQKGLSSEFLSWQVHPPGCCTEDSMRCKKNPVTAVALKDSSSLKWLEKDPVA